jgi:hypothetical protein
MFGAVTKKIVVPQKFCSDICIGLDETFRALYNMSRLLA